MTSIQSTDWMLVVEDQIDLWVLLKAHLKTVLPQVQLIHASNKPAALSCLEACLLEGQLLPRMVLSDLYMPYPEDGLSLLTSLKESSSIYGHLPIVIVSSSTNDQDRQEVNRRGGTYLAKPVDHNEWIDYLKCIRHYWHKSIPRNKE